MSDKEKDFTIIDFLRVLCDNSQKKLTLDEISKKAGKDYTILPTDDINRIMEVISSIRIYINSFELDTKTVYQITSKGISFFEENILKKWGGFNAQKEKARKEKEMRDRYGYTEHPSASELTALPYTSRSISREEYKKLKRWEKRMRGLKPRSGPTEEFTFSRLQKYEIKEERFKRRFWVIVAIATVVTIVVLFITL